MRKRSASAAAARLMVSVTFCPSATVTAAAILVMLDSLPLRNAVTA